MSRVVHYAATGFKPQLIEIAPDAHDPESKRSHLIEEEDKNLNRNLGELEEGTRARNREILRRLNEVWSQTSGWEAKMLTEEKEAEESALQIRREYERHISDFHDQFSSDVRKTFRHIDDELLPIQINRVLEQEKSLDYFVKTTVPQTIEAQSGEVSRQLKKQYETFDIEKQKGKKKENKFLQRADAHLQTTAQRFTDEDALLAACFFSLEEDIISHERRSARMHLRRSDNATRAVLELEVLLAALLEKRRREDVDVLDTIIETQSLLQKTILEHFGSDSQAKAFGEKPNFKKLESRMAASRERNSRGGSGAGTGTGAGTGNGGGTKGQSSVISKLPPSGNKTHAKKK